MCLYGGFITVWSLTYFPGPFYQPTTHPVVLWRVNRCSQWQRTVEGNGADLPDNQVEKKLTGAAGDILFRLSNCSPILSKRLGINTRQLATCWSNYLTCYGPCYTNRSSDKDTRWRQCLIRNPKWSFCRYKLEPDGGCPERSQHRPEHFVQWIFSKKDDKSWIMCWICFWTFTTAINVNGSAALVGLSLTLSSLLLSGEYHKHAICLRKALPQIYPVYALQRL